MAAPLIAILFANVIFSLNIRSLKLQCSAVPLLLLNVTSSSFTNEPKSPLVGPLILSMLLPPELSLKPQASRETLALLPGSFAFLIT